MINRKNMLGRGYIHVYCGDGKGKTTAALGLALRAAGSGLKVYICQFLKNGRYSELKTLKRLKKNILVRQYGRGCFVRRRRAGKEDRRLAEAGLLSVRKAFRSGLYDLVIMDELNVAVYFGLLRIEDVEGTIQERPEGVELVITGRKAPREILRAADLVTEMREIKHYYKAGIEARKGIES